MNRLVRVFDDSNFRASCVTVGNFDGIHLGHRAILNKLVSVSASMEAVATVVSFDPHPRYILENGSPALLTTIAERAEMCRELGIQRFATVAFDREFATWPAERFVRDILVAELHMKAIVLGHDHRFGRKREGDDQLLEELGHAHGFTSMSIGPTTRREGPVSSSRIRSMLLSGDVTAAEDLLGYRYHISGTVVPGAARGRTIGFPTANLSIDHPDKVIPLPGVYAVRVLVKSEQDAQVQEGQWDELPGGGMMNIGTRPTFDDDGLHVEVHVLDFEGDLYGREVRVEFVERLREERKFDSVEALIGQLNEDRVRCTAALEQVN